MRRLVLKDEICGHFQKAIGYVVQLPECDRWWFQTRGSQDRPRVPRCVRRSNVREELTNKTATARLQLHVIRCIRAFSACPTPSRREMSLSPVSLRAYIGYGHASSVAQGLNKQHSQPEVFLPYKEFDLLRTEHLHFLFSCMSFVGELGPTSIYSKYLKW